LIETYKVKNVRWHCLTGHRKLIPSLVKQNTPSLSLRITNVIQCYAYIYKELSYRRETARQLCMST